MYMLKLDSRGAISMLTVIFLALLLTIITTSFVRLSVTEQRQAIDDDLTTRAFYAAESGVEDAKRAISDFQEGLPVNLNESDCNPADVVADGILSNELDTEYTCQLIDMSPANFQAELAAWESVTVPLNGATAFDTVFIEWHVDDGSDYNLRNNSELLTVSDWNSGNGHPAMLRTATFFHGSPTFTSDEIEQSTNTKFLNPANGSGSASTTSGDGQIADADCDQASVVATGAYACSMRLTGINSGRTNYLRLQSLYRSTNVRVTLLDSSNNPVLLEDVQAIIDVTGRAGDVFRRVEARVSLIADDFAFPDIALWSNTDICKDFSVTDDPADYNNSCPWAP